MDDVPILEVYSPKRTADLSAELNVVDGRKLAKEAQARIKLAYQRLAHHHLWRCFRVGLRGSIAFTIRISQPGKADGCDCYPHCNPQSGWRPSVSPLPLYSGCGPVPRFVHVVTSQVHETLKPVERKVTPAPCSYLRQPRNRRFSSSATQPQTAETSRPTVFRRDGDWRCEPSLA